MNLKRKQFSLAQRVQGPVPWLYPITFLPLNHCTSCLLKSDKVRAKKALSKTLKGAHVIEICAIGKMEAHGWMLVPCALGFFHASIEINFKNIKGQEKPVRLLQRYH
jgi:hypothetical protein